MSIPILIAFVLHQGGPGPLDAFRANSASISAEIDYESSLGKGDAGAIASGAIWEGRGVDFVKSPGLDVVGEWECDGAAERSRFGSPREIVEPGRADPSSPANEPLGAGMAVGIREFFIPETEALYDGRTLAVRREIIGPSMSSSDTVYAWRGGIPGALAEGRGPFLWWGPSPFPQVVSDRFAGIEPIRSDGERAGRPVEVEVYSRQLGPEGWIRIEVAYDPSVGYLPRHGRLISAHVAGPTWVKGFFLVSARPCAAGGFVPTEWYTATLAIDDFARKYPDYSEETRVLPTSGRLGMEHFLATGFRDRSGPVGMEWVEGVRAIATQGGEVPLQSAPRRLSMAAIESRLDSILATPPPPPSLPSTDIPELRQSAPASQPDLVSYIAGSLILALAILALALLARRRVQALTLLAGLLSAAG